MKLLIVLMLAVIIIKFHFVKYLLFSFLAISACEYLDVKTLITASMDKTVKVWDLETNKCIKYFSLPKLPNHSHRTLILNDKPTVDDMQQGATLIKDGICSLSLNGTLNFWRNALSLSDKSLPSDTAIGHQVML